MKYLLLLITLITNTCTLYSEDQIAEVSFYDSKSKIHMSNFSYYIDTSKIQYGVKFGVNVYPINISECNLEIPDDLEEYFAAHLSVPDECSVPELLKEVQNHGADFVFLDLRHHSDFEKVLSNEYQNPVFVIDNKNEEDFFRFNKRGVVKRYVNIFFHMVG